MSLEPIKLHRSFALALPRVILDFETRSEVDIEEVGGYVYAQHTSTCVLVLCYKLRGIDEPVYTWRPRDGEPFPELLLQWIEAGYMFEAHQAQFEKAIFRYVVCPKYNVPMPEFWCDTQAACAYRALPLKLDAVTKVLDLGEKKDARGKLLIRKLCEPQKISVKEAKAGVKFPKWNNDPALMTELDEYCAQDVVAEEGLGEAIRDLPPSEYEIWCLDQQINERGVFIDIAAVQAAASIVEKVELRLLKELATLTNGDITTANQLDRMQEWCAKRGWTFVDMTADTIKELVKRADIKEDKDVYRLLQLRQALGKVSVKKIAKLIGMRMEDGRVRGNLMYHGASTGRWSGRGVQMQNIPRGDEEVLQPLVLKDQLKDAPHLGMDLLIETILTGDDEVLELLYGDAFNALSSAIRGFLIAAPGNELYVADFSAIEARVLAWVAGEQWKLDAFAGIDRGEGYKGSQDIYLATASGVYGYPCLTKKTHPAERHTGKTCELAFGYQGGVGAWRKFDDSDKWTDAEVDEKKKAWRAAHPRTEDLWEGLENAAGRAVETGLTCRYREISYGVVKSPVGNWLACVLPNGRCLWYYKPEVEKYEWYGKTKYRVSYEGKDNKKGGAWGRIDTYGGMLAENVVQAISRDIMVEAMFRVEEAGYPLILTVHDEVVCEVPFGTGNMQEFNRLVSVVPKWTPGLPIGVAGWHGTRYRKD